MERMLVTEGLNELKTLSKRITDKILTGSFIDCAKKSEKNVKPNVSKEEFKTKALSDFDSINALIDRREAIKAAIIASNAVTEVEIGGNKMTVAKAIDTKSSIGFKEILLNEWQEAYSECNNDVTTGNKAVEDKIDSLVMTAYGRDGKDKISESEFKSIADPYKAANELELVDPLNLKDKIDALKEEIETFKSDVDAKLQISNCMTYIEV